MGRARAMLSRPGIDAFLASCGLDDLVAIGGSNLETDLFLLVSAESETMPGAVLWWAEEEIDRFADFAAFFAAMTAYNQRIARKLSGAND